MEKERCYKAKMECLLEYKVNKHKTLSFDFSDMPEVQMIFVEQVNE